MALLTTRLQAAVQMQQEMRVQLSALHQSRVAQCPTIAVSEQAPASTVPQSDVTV